MSKINRRDFFKLSLGIGSGLVIGFNLQSCNTHTTNENKLDNAFKPNAWLKISTDNTITITVAESEMGQGIMTSLPMLIAEELDADWSSIQVERAPVDPAFGYQVTGGSTSVRNAWQPLREAGSAARSMLISAAALNWKIPEAQCLTELGYITNKLNDKKLSYGELAEAAAQLDIPQTSILKDPEDFKIIGKSTPLLNAPDMIKGRTIFGCDVSLPGMLIATITHCPFFSGKLISFDSNDAKKISGVESIFQIDNSIVIVGNHYWAVKKAQDLLKINWQNKTHNELTSERIFQMQNTAMQNPADIIHERGDIDKALSSAEKIITATYQSPFQAHATMEPMNCVAHVHDDICEVWAPTQSPDRAKETASDVLYSKTEKLTEKVKQKLGAEPSNNIHIHTTFLGGGFGRRLQQDYVAEAVKISKITGKPIKLIWSREEDIQHDYYRPATSHKLEAGLNKAGKPVAWKHLVVGSSKGKSTGGAANSAYAIDHFSLQYIQQEHPIPTGPWRSVGDSHNGFILESFIDELANAASEDPYEYRAQLLTNAPRHKAVLDKAAEKSAWGKPLPEGHFQGIALHNCYGSYVAQVAEISVNKLGKVKVHRVVCVIDCGMVINPDTIKAQMEGGIVFGLTACLKSAITIKNGRVAQSNLNNFQLLKMHEMPIIETHIISSNEAPGGVGEPPVPPIAAAVTNAVYAATGKRIRKLPIQSDELI